VKSFISLEKRSPRTASSSIGDRGLRERDRPIRATADGFVTNLETPSTRRSARRRRRPSLRDGRDTCVV
jgi:hypothetical protein